MRKWSSRRINMLADRLRAESYLEIGVQNGDTFFDVEIKRKTAVDPRFRFSPPAHDDNSSFFEKTSDEFFRLLGRDVAYDIIFIDGLHTFEQTYRDFCNCLIHSNANTVFLIDDTVPSDVFSCLPTHGAAIEERKRIGLNSVAWHGDTFKIVFAIHDFHLGLKYKTINTGGNGQTLVWRSKQYSRKPIFNNFEKISRMSFFDIQLLENVLCFSDEESAINECCDDLASG